MRTKLLVALASTDTWANIRNWANCSGIAQNDWAFTQITAGFTG